MVGPKSLSERLFSHSPLKGSFVIIALVVVSVVVLEAVLVVVSEVVSVVVSVT